MAFAYLDFFALLLVVLDVFDTDIVGHSFDKTFGRICNPLDLRIDQGWRQL